MLTTLNHTISQKVAEVFDLYTELHGARISFFGPDRKILYPDAEGRTNCSYCRMLRGELGLESCCRELDRKMMDAALQESEMISYTCHGGMREAVSPLFTEGQLAGFVMIGQFRSRSASETSPYAEKWKQTRGNNKLQQAFEKSTVFPEEKIEMLLAMFSQLLELILRSQLIHHKDYDLIEPVTEWIQQHPEQVLSLEEAARMTVRSPSTVTRLFKKMTGRSFKQYQSFFRLQRAAELLKNQPSHPVAVIAQSVGFDDPLYFSRIFHKHAGCSPREYRERNNAER
ncbi:MAG: PocR ligand-binding domain-containing protein [Kiritimatiellales bacterium]